MSARIAAVSSACTLIGLLLLAGPRADRPPTVGPQPAPPHTRWSGTAGDGLPVRAPNPWFFAERAFPQGRIPREAWQQAQLQATVLRDEARRAAAELAQPSTSEPARPDADRDGGWVATGPTNVGGRITAIAIDPSDQDIVYAGCAEGGILRSVDGGQSWEPIFDDQPSLSMGAVAIDPSDPQVIYAGTGEVNPGGGSVAYGGSGLFRSSNGGDSWESIGLENSGSIGRIRVDPSDPQRIFVAVSGHLWEPGPDRGVYRTTDGGQSWQRVLFVDEATGCIDLIQRPDQPDVLLAAMWERMRQPEFYDYGGPGCAVYRTDNGGDNWSLVQGGLPPVSNDGGRIGLSLCASQPEVMHAIYADRVGYFDGLYRSTDGGTTWNRTTDSALSNVYSSYGWWFGNVRTHPIDANLIYVLGLEFYRSTNGGASYQNVGTEMHVDHHGLGFGPGPDPVLFEGNDGGIYRSTDAGNFWTFLADQPITQVYRLALAAPLPDAIFIGAQDNGTYRTVTGGLDDWQHIFGGDGFQPLVHPVYGNRVWAQYQYGNLSYSPNGGDSWQMATSGVYNSDRVAWNMPLIQDPTDPDRRYLATHRVYRSTGNVTWEVFSPDLTGGPHLDNPGQVRGSLTTLAVSAFDGDVIWAGSDDGRVHVRTAATDWTDVSVGLPERWITSVRCDPFQRETAYVTVSGFRWAEPLPHVYRTVDLGANWEPIVGNLPEAPANEILPDPDVPGRYFVATDVGVYETTDGGTTWSALGADLPRVVITSLAFRGDTRTLVVGTYGRSTFAIAVDDAATGVGDTPDETVVASLGALRPLYPNPTGGATTIAFEARRDVDLTVEVYSVAGRRIWTSRLAAAAGQTTSLQWSGRDEAGRPAASGIYLVRVSSAGRVLGRQTVVLRR